MQNNKNFIRQVHVKQKIFNRSNKVASEEWIFQYFLFKFATNMRVGTLLYQII